MGPKGRKYYVVVVLIFPYSPCILLKCTVPQKSDLIMKAPVLLISYCLMDKVVRVCERA